MDKSNDVSRQIKELLTDYDFNQDTLAKYLSLDVRQVQELTKGNVDILCDDNTYRFQLFNKVLFLSLIPKEDNDVKISAFLEVLISYHNLSIDTIAKMSNVAKKDIESILYNQLEKVPTEIKYKVAVTVMALRFFLKETEQKK